MTILHLAWMRRIPPTRPRASLRAVALFSSTLLLSVLAPAVALAQSPVVLSGYTVDLANDTMTLSGQDFGAAAQSVTVDNQPADITNWNADAITVTIPAAAGPGPIVVTTFQGLTSNALTFAGVARGSYTLSANGTVTPHGAIPFYGDLSSAGAPAGTVAVQLVPTADYQGYWILTQQGVIYSFGDAAAFADSLPEGSGPAVAMAVTSSGRGGFVLTQNGTVAAVGTAQTYGNTPAGMKATSIAATPDGQGYWILTAQGAVEAFGDASNEGSLPVAAPATYANETLIRQAGTAPVWVVENGQVHHVPNPAILQAMGLRFSQVQVVSSLAGLTLGAPLVTPYPSGTVLQAAGQTTLYLVDAGVLRPLSGMSALAALGLSANRVLRVSQINPDWPQGPALAPGAEYLPSGTLVRAQGSQWVYMVNQGTLEHVMNPNTLLGMGYQWDQVQEVSALPALPVGPSLASPARAYPTGTLLRPDGQAAVYLVQNGTARHVPSAAVLAALGYQFSQVVPVASLQGMPVGTALESTELPTAATAAVDLVPTASGQGYWILQADGTVTALGNAVNFGEPSSAVSATQLVVSVDQQGYDVITAQGQALAFGDEPALSVASGAVSVAATPLVSASTTPVTTPTTPAASAAPTGLLSMGYGYFADDFPNGANNSSYEDLLQHASGLSVINPAWFNVVQQPGGSWGLTSWSTQGVDATPLIGGQNNVQVVTQQAHAEGVMVLPSIGDYYNPGAGPIDTAAEDTQLVQQIVTLVQQDDFDGITIDFENGGEGGLSVAQASAQYTAFIQELGTALHAAGKLLMVAVYPSDYPDTIYNYAALAPYVNYINMMTYPEDNASTYPGPTAGEPWVQSLLQAALSAGVSPQQIVLGVAPYGHEWTVTNAGVTGDSAVSNRAVSSLVQQDGITPLWDSTQEENVFTAGPAAQLPPAGLSIQDDSVSKPTVANLQNLLNVVLLQYAVQHDQTPPLWLPTDGYYGPETTAAVTAFQQDFNVSEATPGEYDAATAAALQTVISQEHIGQNIYWDENSQSTIDRVQLAVQNNLAGVAVWRLPFETSNYWTDLTQLTPIAHE